MENWSIRFDVGLAWRVNKVVILLKQKNINCLFFGCPVFKYFLFTRYSQDKRSKVPKLRYICHLVLVSEVLDHNPLPEKAFVWENSTCFDWNEKYLLPTIVKSKSINNYGVFKSFTTTFVWLFVIVLLSIIIRIIPTFQKEEDFNFQLKFLNTYSNITWAGVNQN